MCELDRGKRDPLALAKSNALQETLTEPEAQPISPLISTPLIHLYLFVPLSPRQALVRLNQTWGKVSFLFQPHRSSGPDGSQVSTVKMEEQDFEALEDNQVLVQASGRGKRQGGM